MKGVFELCPPNVRYDYVCYVDVFLNFLCVLPSNDQLPLSHLKFKLCMLLALSTMQRVQTLHAIDISTIIFGQNAVVIPITTLLKHSSQRRPNFSLRLPYFHDDPELCVTSVLVQYLEATKDIRRAETQLFISFRAPFHAVSKDTINRWITTVLKEAGIDVVTFKAHVRLPALQLKEMACRLMQSLKLVVGRTAILSPNFMRKPSSILDPHSPGCFKVSHLPP